MSRGGRRRKTRRSARPAEAPVTAPSETSDPTGRENQPAAAPGRRDGGRRSQAREVAKPAPARLRTLPPDGVVLEELIAGMQDEYGVPATPQEYRLLIRVPAAEDAGAAATSEPDEVLPPDQEDAASRTPRTRRRRRGRRLTGGEPGTAGEDGAGETAAT